MSPTGGRSIPPVPPPRPVSGRAAPGRPPATSRAELERAAFGLFAERDFGDITVEDIASAAGIGRRTFFRYFDSKNDVVWGDFRGHLERMRADLAAVPPDVDLGPALIDSIVAFNTYPEEEVAGHRQRMAMILSVPELQAHSTLQYAAWRQVVAEFVARRTGARPDDLGPQVVARTALGAAVAAYEKWLTSDAEPLVDVLRQALGVWSAGIDGWDVRRPASRT